MLPQKKIGFAILFDPIARFFVTSNIPNILYTIWRTIAICQSMYEDIFSCRFWPAMTRKENSVFPATPGIGKESVPHRSKSRVRTGHVSHWLTLTAVMLVVRRVTGRQFGTSATADQARSIGSPLLSRTTKYN